MAHPLDGSFARIRRAEKHLSDLLVLVEAFERLHKDLLYADYHEQSGKVVIGMKHPPEVPVDVSLVVSDTVHNLRAALDYLVYELARQDSGKIVKNTQFPIEDVKFEKLPNGNTRGFDTRLNSYLRGISSAHVAAIESLQPYKGVQWTKTLREVSNPDKHRRLLALGQEFLSDATITTGSPGGFDGMPGLILRGVGADGCDLYVELEHAISIQFEDGLPVLQTLQALKEQVAATIDAFKLEFKG